MQPHHWNEGESLPKELRSQKSQLVVVGDDGEDRIQDGFRILERMNQELKYQNHRNSSPPSLPSPQQLQQQRTLPQPKGGRHLPFLPLEYYTLAAVLLAWRDYILA